MKNDIFNESTFIEPTLDDELDSHCFDAIEHEGPLDESTTKYCYDRDNNLHYLACQLGFSPFESHVPRINIFTSRNTVGLAIMGLLQSQEFQISEVKSYFHFSTHSIKYAKIFNKFNFPIHIAIDPQDDQCELLYHLKSPVLIVTSFNNTYKDYPHLHVIKAPHIYGPTYPFIYGDPNAESILDACMNNPWQLNTTSLNLSQEYAYSGDVAIEVVKIMKQILSGEKPDNFSVKTIKQGSLIAAIRDKYPKCNIPPVDFKYTQDIKTNLKTMIKYNKKQRRKPTDVYLSWVTSVCDTPRVIERANEQLAYYAEYFKRIPTLSMEFVYVYAHLSEFSKPFNEVFTVPKEIKNNMRIIEIPSIELLSLNMHPNKTQYPEFKLKNIGIRKAKGEYIISGNSDILPGYPIIDHVVRRLFSPGLYRSLRYNGKEQVPRDFVNLSQFYTYPDNWLANYDYIDYTAAMSSLLTKASGDFQGCHRKQWEIIHGFLETGQTFYVDSWFLLEFCGFKFPTVVRSLGYHVHLDHVKVSHYTSSIDTNQYFWRGMVCDGWFSKDVDSYKRDKWGLRQSFTVLDPDITNFSVNVSEGEFNVSYTFDKIRNATATPIPENISIPKVEYLNDVSKQNEENWEQYINKTIYWNQSVETQENKTFYDDENETIY
ncbi:hypothetical protein TVAG_198310 [Trichomonas vaginalis G3]|uniref:Uncharacterized protein n=1 Tax=Trichomonas vaginalis (strain ATCC PRA-98 / G3) TaxID=412133 RepID=A2DDL7_TRIV3|nr:hypothetical protein TVAGG3_0998730 [Trichomonas vaginalis G3]EAY21393.1 hypothetical protein TVAG_198310 [Trichomonas vaginalis G3]KAI5490606.1 hypothetical protein TVAGG3_0998730 [Trichomonas vaginalis G3]|eukprot:XP_001582379.1 hypothetical protein [Trichomonas vaginalis G3]